MGLISVLSTIGLRVLVLETLWLLAAIAGAANGSYGVLGARKSVDVVLSEYVTTILRSKMSTGPSG